MMPSSTRYEELKSVLRSTTKAFDNAETYEARLEADLAALRAVIRYLHGDEEVLDKFLTKPLADVENALHDAGKGASPPLLDHPPSRAGKPADTTRESIQAMLAIAVDLLIAAQFGKNAAVKWVADAARALGIRTLDDAVITAKQIDTMRSEIKKQRAPLAARNLFAGAERLPEHAAVLRGPHDASKRQHAQARARAVINAIAATMPRSASKQQRRSSGRAS
jgi:hypothetical protein